MATHEYRIKCQNCGLHYVVLSWDEQWAGAPEHGRRGGFCPECGIPGGKMVWGPVEVEGQIFERVPGHVAVEEINGEKIAVPPSMIITQGPPPGLYGIGGKQRGPYGTNDGDIWDADGSDVQNSMDAREPGKKLIHEVIDGEEKLYVVETDTEFGAETYKRAKAGGLRHAQAQAAQAARDN